MAAKKHKSTAGTTSAPDTGRSRKASVHVFADKGEAQAYLRARLNVEATSPALLDLAKAFRLERMAALMERLGNPQASFKSVHVAGSKGKGSVCEMVGSCLEACGYTVGVYTSPHLVEMSERIRISGSRISDAEFVAMLGQAAGAAQDLSKALGEVTHFELMTATAFLHFAEQAVDVAVIETGMGGRFDATNVITPEVSVITAIHLEHTPLLGKTLEEIALHKAGIIKPGSPAVTMPQAPEVMKVLREAAAGTTLEVLGEDIDFSFRFESSPELGPHTRVVVSTPRSSFEHLPVPLKGEHQAFNCGLALAALDKLRLRGLETPESQVAQGLSRTPNNGRLEQVYARPRIMIDGAHNPESVRALMKAVGAQVRYDSMVCVFGCASDKDVPGMLSALATGADKIIFTRAPDNARASDPRDLQKKFAEVSGKMTQCAPNVKDALNMASRAVARDDLILVAGSFALAGEAKRLLAELQKKEREPSPDHALREIKPSGISPAKSSARPNRPGRPS